MKRLAPYILFTLCVYQAQADVTYIEGTPFASDSEKRTWDDCKDEAQLLGLELASIADQAENDALSEYIQTEHWIGGYQIDALAEPDGNWAWSDGSTWGYTNWHDGEPNNAFSSEHFVEMRLDGAWNDLFGFDKRKCVYRNTTVVVALTPAPTTGPTLEPTLSPTASPTTERVPADLEVIEGSPFIIDNVERSWNDCLKTAESITSLELASVTDQADNDAIQDEIKSEVWIGGYQTDALAEPDGNWAWSDGSTWGYTNWANGEPNNAFSSEHFVEMKLDGTWNDQVGSDKRKCVYRNTTVVVALTPAPTTGPTLEPTLSPTASPTTERAPVDLTDVPGTNFKIDNVARSWKDCNATAVSNGYTMASIEHSGENAAIANDLKKKVWIGAYQAILTNEPAGGWAWSDGSAFFYANWAATEPNDAFSEEHYVHMNLDGTWNDIIGSQKFACLYEATETFNPPTVPPSPDTPSPTASPTSHITKWAIGPSEYSLHGGSNYFDGYLEVSNSIGSSVTEDIEVQLYDYDCLNEKENFNSTFAVSIFDVDPDPSSFDFSVNISQSNIGNDPGGFVYSTGLGTGDIKFCTRVSTYEGSIEVAVRTTNFILSYNLTDNMFILNDIAIEEEESSSFADAVETDFSTYVYQCENYVETTPPPLDQDERLTVCLEPQQGGVSTDLVYIANFNLRLHAGSALDGNDVEYDPVWFGTDGYEYNQLTDVTSEPSGNIIMIKTPVVAGFYIKKHTTIDLDGNCFFEFESPSKEGMASIFGVFDMQVELLGTNQEGGCLTKLMSMIRNFF